MRFLCTIRSVSQKSWSRWAVNHEAYDQLELIYVSGGHLPKIELPSLPLGLRPCIWCTIRLVKVKFLAMSIANRWALRFSFPFTVSCLGQCKVHITVIRQAGLADSLVYRLTLAVPKCNVQHKNNEENLSATLRLSTGFELGRTKF